ncbi:methyl-accepting chemotaxis protein [Oceanospirillum sediminis]|uniref:Methyl-accepting chemotaxis protein n=1 Tax=Oceanospirillum sediminis TaxID=2760088 RepID=A0A839IUS7_9GAMM|nr:methyl-accepting chemotaxis protein [Oceanospirillum sediminis]MBB1488708.1 methyl-accepting chemotaxis protein [Oceanospirillum sediminis]
MNITRKLSLGFALLIVLFTGLGLYLNQQLNHLGESAIAAFEQPLQAVDQSRAAWDTFRSSRELASRQLARIHFSDTAQAGKELKQLQEMFLIQLETAYKATEALMVAGDFNAIKSTADQWYNLNYQRISGKGLNSLPDEKVLTDLEQRLGTDLEKLVQDSLKAAMQQQEHTVQLVDRTMTLSSILLISAVILGALIAFGLGRSLSSPLKELLAAIKDLAQGEGDLTRRLHLKRSDEIGELADEVNLFISKIHSLVSDTRTSLSAASDSLSSMGQMVQNTYDGVSRQKDELTKASAAVNQVTQTVEIVSENSHQAKEQAEKISNEARDSLQLVLSYTRSINQLADEVSSASHSIQELSVASDSITELLTVIESIADQTNLLALNAAIEAARAGEAGRGFAVVADEVRSLAMKTRESTEHIQETVCSITGKVGESRQVMERGRDLAISCVEQSQSVSEALTKMNEGINQIEQMNLSIAAETEQQRQAMVSINANMEQVNQVADDTQCVSRNMQSSQGELDSALGLVEQKMRQFKMQ